MDGICIIGVAANTPAGFDALSTSAACRGAICTVAEHPVYLDSVGNRVFLSRDRRIAPTLDWRSRVTALASSAAVEAIQMAMAAAGGASDRQFDILLAMPEPRPGTVADVEGQLSREIAEFVGRYAPIGEIRCAWQGHAAGLLSIRYAIERLRDRRASLVLIVGVDSYVCPQTLEWLDANKQLKREGRRSGFPPGEAAAAVVLARDDDAVRWGAPLLGRVLAAGAAIEPNRIKTDTICVGEGLTAAMRAALQPLERSSAKVTDSYCDLNGERYRSEEVMFAIVRVSPLFTNAAGYITPADCFGDVGAASGLLFVTLAVVAGMRGSARGSFALAWAGSENGYRAAVLLQLPVKASPFR